MTDPVYWNLLAAGSGAAVGVVVSHNLSLRFVLSYLFVGVVSAIWIAPEAASMAGFPQLSGTAACFVCGFAGMPLVTRAWQRIRPKSWGSDDDRDGFEHHP
jgi:hypothetical protein